MVLAGGGARWRVNGRLADPPGGSTSSTYIWPRTARGRVEIENPAADGPLAKGGLNGGHRPPLPCGLPMEGFPYEFGPETER